MMRQHSWGYEEQSHPSLSFYPRVPPTRISKHLNGSRDSLILTKYRIDNWSDFNYSTCKACNKNMACLKTHVSLHCQVLPISQDLRKVRSQAIQGIQNGQSIERILMEMFDDPSFSKAIANTHKAWIKRGGGFLLLLIVALIIPLPIITLYHTRPIPQCCSHCQPLAPCRDFSCIRSHSTPECDEAFFTYLSTPLHATPNCRPLP